MHICVIVVPKGRCIKTFKIDIDAVDIVDMNGRKGKGVYFPNIDIDTESTISTVFTNSDIITTFFN